MDYKDRISDVAKTVFNFSKSRTGNVFDAEDLSQEILLELCRSIGDLRSEDAFYGFMWSVANNVCKRWYAKKNRLKQVAELDFDLPDADGDAAREEDERIALLRREIGLLSEKHRRALILYYVENKSCSEISSLLGTSESMVKYLLFKSRKKLKEGITMERVYGEQSYNPKSLKLLFWFWGAGSNRYFEINDDKIAQNVLFACYNDRLTPEQISLEIGVTLPYLEPVLKKLCGADYLIKEGNRYLTNVVIFTDDLKRELRMKNAPITDKIADLVEQAIVDNEERIRKIGFVGSDMGANSFAWQIASMILYKAAVNEIDKRVSFVRPKDRFGCECVVCGVENYENDELDSRFGVGITNARNGRIRFVDFPVNGEMLHHKMFEISGSYQVFYDIANGVRDFSENDRAIAAELVRIGCVKNGDAGLSVNAPVFTREQFKEIEEILAEVSGKVADEIKKMLETSASILENHVPSHLKPVCGAVSYLRILDDAMAFVVEELFARRFLAPYNGTDLLPTTFVVADE